MIKLLLVLLFFQQGYPQASIEELSEEKPREGKDTIYIFGDREELGDLPGSIHKIGQKELEVFKYSDVHRVLKEVPGVYLQEEDALGLRPNIGLRGVHPHRSRKITLMEDGILIAPAPYSAPAAYYFPNMHKIGQVEVYKGPSSIRYGPNSIGGAVNLITRSAPRRGDIWQIDWARGLSSFDNQKLHFVIGEGNKRFSWLMDITRLESDGVKTLPRGMPTGFEKNDVMIKMSWPLYRHKIDLKLARSDEQSHETYLGLTESDFSASPYRRYAASANDLMDWDHYQVQLRHRYDFSNLVLSSGLYHHRFIRNWSKISGFRDGTTMKKAIDTENNPIYSDYLGLLKGEIDSIAKDKSDSLVMGNNDRSYFSQGIFVDGDYLMDGGTVSHNLRFGFRSHQDRVDRNHTRDFYSMTNGSLKREDLPAEVSSKNRDTSWANTFYVEDEVSFVDGKWKLTVGSRLETVDSKRIERDLTELNKSDMQIVPGIGLFWKAHKNLGFLAGAGRGVILSGPGDAANIRPEESVNYELGFRYDGYFNWETIGFLNDYQNIKGVCSFSSGCDNANLDREFNGGEAIVYGIENKLYHNFRFGKFVLPVQVNYTATVAKFTENSFTENPEWGSGLKEELVKKGDPLPYIPNQQLGITLGIRKNPWGLNVSFSYQGRMFDQSVEEGRKIVDGHTVFDGVFHYNYTKKGNIYLRMDNILDKSYIVSYRPFGARPGKPRSILAGVVHRF